MKKISILILVVWLVACDSSNNEPGIENNSNDRQLILTNWADNIIIPSYDNFKTKFNMMESKAVAFTETPDVNTLAELRSAWADAYHEWQKVELFEFGPAERYTMRNFFNIYPTDVAGILANINDPALSLEIPASYARQGFPALDYLLNGVGDDDTQIVAFYTSDAQAAKNLDYLNRLITRMNGIVDKVVTEWPTYRSTFISKTGLDIGSSMGIVVNAYVLNYERYIRSGKFGIPSGAITTGVTYPEKVEAYYKKDIGRGLAKTAHQASLDFFLGKSILDETAGPSFKSYLDKLDAKDLNTGTALSGLIQEQFEIVNDKIDPLSANLSEEVNSNNDAMKAVYTEMQKLVSMLKVDMTSAMSITITYTDNDGD